MSSDDEENYMESLRKRFKMSSDHEHSSSRSLSLTSSNTAAAAAEICERKWTPINIPGVSPGKSPFKVKLSTPGNSSVSYEESVASSQYSSTSEEREATPDAAIDIEDWLPPGYVKDERITAVPDDELLAELTDIDRAMFRLRDQGMTWIEVANAIEEETGEKHHPTTIGKRYGRLCRELYRWESIDEHALKLAAEEVQAEFDAFIKNARENKWSMISQKMAIHGGSSFPLFSLQTKYNDIMRRVSIPDVTASIGDKDRTVTIQNDGNTREYLSVVEEVDNHETSSTMASSVEDDDIAEASDSVASEVGEDKVAEAPTKEA